ncbi:MAG: Bro-N domain-containing protein [Hyphomicrobium sp.]|jgi:prophage antirepressor-like protein
MNSKPRNKTALVFQETKFEVVDLEGEPGLRSPQIGEALGYENPSQAIEKLYKRNAAEFTADMTQLIDLPTAGGIQKTRVFNLRGAHLLGMLASTAKAMDFRRWVLDILDGRVAPQETGRMTYPQRLAYLKERRALARELSVCAEQGLATELYENLWHVSRLLGITPCALELLAPGLRQQRIDGEGGAA